MGRKTWVKPMTMVQKFEANEPVAASACFQVACKSDVYYSTAWDKHTGDPGDPCAPMQPWGKKEGNYNLLGWFMGYASFYHENCHTASKNIFNVENGVITYIDESGGSATEGGFTHWQDVNENKVVDSGDVLYWWNQGNTSAGQPTVWNHWGTVTTQDSSRSLHS